MRTAITLVTTAGAILGLFLAFYGKYQQGAILWNVLFLILAIERIYKK